MGEAPPRRMGEAEPEVLCAHPARGDRSSRGAPAERALFMWFARQGMHRVATAAVTAISSLYFRSSALGL